MNLLKDFALSRSLCSIAQTTVIASLWLPGFRKACFWERLEAPLPPLRPRPECNVIHPRHFCPCAERLVLPFSSDEILSGYEEFDSSVTDLFTSWVKMREQENLVHIVDIEKATAEFREASERKRATSSHMNSSNKRFATRSIVQRRLGIYNWNPGPRGGKEDAFEQQIAWTVACHYFARSVWLRRPTSFSQFASTRPITQVVQSSLNKDTFHPNVDVSIYLHDTRRDLPDHVMEEGEQGWFSRCSFTCLFASDRAAGARTRQPENSKRAHFRAPALQNTTKIPRVVVCCRVLSCETYVNSKHTKKT